MHAFIQKKTFLSFSCIVLLSIQSFLICIHTNASSNTTNTNSESSSTHIHKRSVFSLSFRGEVLKTSLITYFSHNTFLRSFAQKLYLWKRITKDEIIFSFGIEGTNIALGSLQANGFFRIFDDASKTYAWSLRFYERSQWSLKGASSTIPLGLAISYKFSPISLNAWTTLSDLKSKHRIYATGFATTFKAGFDNLYKARFIYQYFMRKFFHLPKSVLRSWYLTLPSTLEVHALATSHEITTSFIDARFMAKLSIPDTLPIGGGASALLRFTFIPITLSIFAQGVSPHYVTSTMKYQKTLWSQSAQLKFSYARISFLRMRYGIHYRNPIANVSSIRHTIDKTIYQSYFVTWKQEILNLRNTQYFLLHYEFISYHVRHKALVYYSFNSASFEFVHGLITTYTHCRKHTRCVRRLDLKYIDMTLDATFVKKEILPHISAFVRIKTRMRVYEYGALTHALTHRVIRDITLSLGALMRIGIALFRVEFPYRYKQSGNFSTKVLLSMRYTID